MTGSADPIARLRDLFETRGPLSFDGEEVDPLQHALQGAWHASRAGAPDSLVCAALLHDVGHLIGRPDLVAREAGYVGDLSPASAHSLALRGGAFSPEEAAGDAGC